MSNVYDAARLGRQGRTPGEWGPMSRHDLRFGLSQIIRAGAFWRYA
jgi:hypothetical protein